MSKRRTPELYAILISVQVVGWR